MRITNNRRKRTAFLCVALALAMFAGCASGGNKTSDEEDDALITKYSLSEVTYPVQVSYPIEEDYMEADGDFDYDAYSAAYDAWWESFVSTYIETQKSMTDEDKNAIPEFFALTAPVFMAAGDDENVVYSPLNVYFAFSLLAEITGGNTRAQILEILGMDDIDSLRKLDEMLWDVSYRDDEYVKEVLGNSLWLREDFPYNEDTIDFMAEEYYAQTFSGTMGEESYNQALRAWINKQTGGLLSEQAEELYFSDLTVLVLVSTIYYKANWSSTFYESSTSERVFYSSLGEQNIDFMFQSDLMSYYDGNGLSACGMSLVDGKTMWFFLPDEGASANSLITDGTVADLLQSEKLVEECRNRTVNMSMPKFDVSSNIDLIDGMEQLGMTNIFDADTADFSPLLADDADNGLCVDDAKHAARVKVNEDGVEAAAYTEIAVSETALMDDDTPIEFVLDRPFVFAIVTGEDIVLFSGVVNTVE